jgi:hypothetical protein
MKMVKAILLPSVLIFVLSMIFSCGSSNNSSSGGGGASSCGTGTYWDGNACQLDQYLAILNAGNYWGCRLLYLDGCGSEYTYMEFYKDNTGKVNSCGVTSITWTPGGSADSMVIDGDTSFNMITNINPSASTNPTSFTATFTTTKGAEGITCTIYSGSF